MKNLAKHMQKHIRIISASCYKHKLFWWNIMALEHLPFMIMCFAIVVCGFWSILSRHFVLPKRSKGYLVCIVNVRKPSHWLSNAVQRIFACVCATDFISITGHENASMLLSSKTANGRGSHHLVRWFSCIHQYSRPIGPLASTTSLF